MISVANLRKHWKSYVWQSACATAVIWLVLVLLSLRQAVIISSIGATTFIVFMKPSNPFAAPRKVLGGYLIGLVLGTLMSLIPHPSPATASTVYALAVGLTLLTMVVTGAEHPPAAGAALSAAISGLSWEAAIAVLASAMLLSLAHYLLRPYLRDL